MALWIVNKVHTVEKKWRGRLHCQKARNSSKISRNKKQRNQANVSIQTKLSLQKCNLTWQRVLSIEMKRDTHVCMYNKHNYLVIYLNVNFGFRSNPTYPCNKLLKVITIVEKKSDCRSGTKYHHFDENISTFFVLLRWFVADRVHMIYRNRKGLKLVLVLLQLQTECVVLKFSPNF